MDLQNKEITKFEILRYIEEFYHARRIHSALRGKTPNQMTKSNLVAKKGPHFYAFS